MRTRLLLTAATTTTTCCEKIVCVKDKQKQTHVILSRASDCRPLRGLDCEPEGSRGRPSSAGSVPGLAIVWRTGTGAPSGEVGLATYVTGGGIPTRPPVLVGEGDERRHGWAGVSARSPYLSEVPGTPTIAAELGRDPGVRDGPSASAGVAGGGGGSGEESLADLPGSGGASRPAE